MSFFADATNPKKVSTSENKLIYLEFLRLVSALLVFITHFSQTSGLRSQSELWHWLENLGHVGVDIFFVLSGFVIPLALTSRPGRGATSFLRGRLKRLVPVYWLITTLAIAVLFFSEQLAIEHSLDGLSPQILLTSFSFTSLIFLGKMPLVAQGWTLEFEMGFYLVVAALLAMFGRLPITWLLVSLTALAWMVDAQFIEFALGVLAFSIHRFLVARLDAAKLIGFALALLGITAVISRIPTDLGDRVSSWSLGAFLIVLGVALLGTPRRLSGIGLVSGALSYPLYLVQWLGIPLCVRLFEALGINSEPLLFLLSLAFNLCSAWLIFRLVDLPVKKKMSEYGW